MASEKNTPQLIRDLSLFREEGTGGNGLNLPGLIYMYWMVLVIKLSNYPEIFNPALICRVQTVSIMNYFIFIWEAMR